MKKFVIQKTNNLGQLEDFEEILANNNVKKSYFYFDKNIEKGNTYYYKIKQVFFDGTFEESNIVVLNYNEQEEFKIQPTIASTNTQLIINVNESQEARIIVLSIDGKVNLIKGANQINCNIHELQSGSYILALKLDSGKVYYDRLVKNNN